MSTERLDEAGSPANDSTQRLDTVNPVSDDSTQRIDDTGSPAGDDSTQRLDAGSFAASAGSFAASAGSPAAGDDSTQRLDDSSAQKADNSAFQMAPPSIAAAQPKMALQSQGDSGKKQGDVFTYGQVVELNGKRYFIEEIISQSSGEAVIYKVSQDGKFYVLKYYKPGYDLPEAVIAKIKDNPRSKIVRTYDYGKHFEQNFEIMELAEGGNLADYLKDKGAVKDIAVLKNIVGQITEGLEQLHSELNIIYQDLKPENIYFRDKEKTNIILADFGISSVMLPGENEAEVRANVTKEYAAPELARIGNNTQVIVGPSVDYFALGITMMYLWLGVKPFQGISESVRVRQIMNKDVIFPADILPDYKILIQGLIDPLAMSRWGNVHVKKWMAGESLQSDYQKTIIKYDHVMFNENEGYSSPEELADLMEKYPDRGVAFLYRGVITAWLEKAQDHFNLLKLQDIIATATDDKEKITGLYAAVYALNPDKPFISSGKKKCFNYSEIAATLMDEAEHYMNALSNRKDFFYLYLIATEGANGPVIADKFHKYFQEYSPRRALSLIYLKLQDDDGRSISIGSKTYYDMDEIAAENDNNQLTLIKAALMEKDSLLNVWLSDNSGGFYETTDGFTEGSVSDRFFLLGKFPFLSYKELVPKWDKTALADLQILTQQCPGRFDLFETYAKQGLPFNGQVQNLDWHPTVLSYLATFFYDIVADENTKLELVKLLHKNGADINEYSGDGSLPLTTAIFKRNVPLVKVLLQLGADPNKEEKYAPIMWALCQNDKGEDEDVRFNLANLLLDHNANVNVSRGDLTCLIMAILLDSSKKVAFIKRLTAAGVNVNKSCDDGITPLMNSIAKYEAYTDSKDKKNEIEVMKLLLAKRAKTNILNKKGYWSPLMRAADANAYDVAVLLVAAGARKDFADKAGDIAYVYAMKKNHQGVKTILDPGVTLKGKAGLLKLARFALTAVPLLWVFLTIDVLARFIPSVNINFPVLIGVCALSSHLLAAYAMIAIFGFSGYLDKLSDIFDEYSLHKAFYFIVGIPVIFPLIIAALQGLSRLLPVNIGELLSMPLEILTTSFSGITMLLMYLLSLAVMMAVLILFDKVTSRFYGIYKTYKQY